MQILDVVKEFTEIADSIRAFVEIVSSPSATVVAICHSSRGKAYEG